MKSMLFKLRKLALLGFWVIGTLLFTAVESFAQSSDPDFISANRAYKSGQYDQAAQLYEKVTELRPGMGAAYFNLGNAYFRMKRMGPSILAFERALIYLPRNQDIRQNLAYVNGLLEYRIKDKRNWYIRAAETVLGYVTYPEVIAAFLFSCFLMMISMFFVLAFRRGIEWGVIRKTLFLLMIITGSIFAVKSIQTSLFKEAIVMMKDSEVHYGPSDADQLAFRLGEGLKVYVVDHAEDWSRIVLANGEGGWIRNQQISLVRREGKPA